MSQMTESPHNTSAKRINRILLVTIVAVSAGTASAIGLQSMGKCEVVGYLKVDQKIISAEEEALISDVFVREGQLVEAGQPLAKVQNRQLAQRIDEQQTIVAGLKSRFDQLNAKFDLEMAWRNREIDQEIFQAEIDASEYLREKYTSEMQSIAWRDMLDSYGGIASTDDSIGLYRELMTSGESLPDDFLITVMLRQGAAQNAVEVYQAQVELCNRRLQRLKQTKETLPDTLQTSLGLTELQREYDIAADKLKRLQATPAEYDVKAEQNCRILEISAKQGTDLTPEQKLMVVLPDETRHIEAYIPSSKIHRFPEGQAVTVRFAGNVQRQGRIVHVPLLTSREFQGSLTKLTDPHIIVRIAPEGALWPDVPFGSQVKVLAR